MIALDSNVLVRLLVADDPAQTGRAKAVVDRLDAEDQRAYVSDIVLCELVWVLSRSYRLKRAELAAALRRLVCSKQLQFDSADQVLRALAAYESGKGDFADYLIREHAKAAGCDTVATFDTAADTMFTAP
jgi:predicted nucleic-acid-binding protein